MSLSVLLPIITSTVSAVDIAHCPGLACSVKSARRVTGDAADAEHEGDGEDDDDDDMDWEYLSSRTEGCQARDLSRLVKR